MKKGSRKRTFYRHGIVLQMLESRQLMAGDLTVQSVPEPSPVEAIAVQQAVVNAGVRADVNSDGRVSAADALDVINRLSRIPAGSPEIVVVEPLSDDFRFDVNGDQRITAGDALAVIWELNRISAIVSPMIDPIERLRSASGRFDFRLTGQASPNVLIRIVQSDVVTVGQTMSGPDGTWSTDVEDASLIAGKFRFTAQQVSPANLVEASSSPASFQPNIVLVNADDMRVEQTQFMPFLLSLQHESTTFENFYVPTSVSGPSRASLLSGLFAAGHGYLNNAPTLGTSLNQDRTSTLPRWMSAAGYRTGLFGKDRTQPSVERQFASQNILEDVSGWDDYFAEAGGGNFAFGADYSDNGVFVETGPDEHITDVVRDQALEFITESAGHSPFFAYVSTHAPHGPGIPTARHQGLLANYEIPRAPSYSPTPQQLAIPGYVELMDAQYIGGSEALFGVDEAIELMFAELSARNVLDNTVFIFTADNGQGLGEHGVFRKGNFWQETLNVPMMIWDGRSLVGQTTDSVATMPDLTQTILDYAAATASRPVDGVSMLPVVNDPATSVRTDFLIQHVYNVSPAKMQFEFGVHTGSQVYVELAEPFQSQTRFLFDLDTDPYQLNNLVDDPSYQSLLSELDVRLEVLRGPDRTAPIIEDFQWELTGGDYDVPQSLRLVATINDEQTGDSEIRTPSILHNLHETFTYGVPMEPSDGVFDSSRESAYYNFTMQDFAELPKTDVLNVATRDVVGNLSQPTRLTTPFLNAPRMVHRSDTGTSSSDGLTLDPRPVLFGVGEPDERVALFSVGPTSELLGTTTVGEDGIWRLRLNLDQAGEHTIFAQIAAPASSPDSNIRILRPLTLHLLAVVDGTLIRVEGTDEADQILVEQVADGSLRLTLNGVEAGSLPAPSRVLINARGGDDYVELRGSIPGRLIGSTGDDTLIGGDGNDILFGGRGSNHMIGGLGDDLYQISFADNQLAAELTLPLVQDFIQEFPDEGDDEVQFDGNFTLQLHLSIDDPNPRITIYPDFDYTRNIYFNDPTTIERIQANQRENNNTLILFNGAIVTSIERHIEFVP